MARTILSAAELLRLQGGSGIQEDANARPQRAQYSLRPKI